MEPGASKWWHAVRPHRSRLALAVVVVLLAGTARPAHPQQNLTCGSVVSGEVASGTIDSFAFTVAGDDSLALDLLDLGDPLGGPVAYRLTAPDGSLLDEFCGFGVELQALDAGTYGLEVFPCAGEANTRYSLSLWPTIDTFAGAASCNRAMDCDTDHATARFLDQDPGAASASGAVAGYRFSQPARGRTRIAAIDTSGSIGSLEVRLYNKTGKLLEDTCSGEITRRLGAGEYTVLVNDCTGTETGTYRLLVDSAACANDATNDTCSVATTITAAPFTDVVNTSRAVVEETDPVLPCIAETANHTAWYRYTATADGTLSADTLGSGYDTVLGAYRGACSRFTPVPGACSDDAGGLQSRISFPVSAGETYWFVAGAFDKGGTLAFGLSFVSGSTGPTPTPTAAGGFCCGEHEGQGCEEADCQSCVCDTDGFCCTDVWDSLCAETATGACASRCVCGTGSTATPTRSPTATPTPPVAACTGDCNGNQAVSVDELVTGVGIALDLRPLADCPALDGNADGRATVDELVRAVAFALDGCPR